MSKKNLFKIPAPSSNSTSSSTDSLKTPQVRQRKISSSSDQSSLCSNVSTFSTTSNSKADVQLQLDLKYNEYLRAKLTHKLLKKKMNENKNLLNEQTIQLAIIMKELNELKCQLEMQKESNSFSKTIELKINENSILANKLLENLQNNCTTFKEILNYFKIMSSKMPLNNVDLTECNNEVFYKSLENINELLNNISSSFATCQINKMKDIFEKIKIKNEQLSKLYKECLEQLNLASSNVIINATNQLSIESRNDSE